ncbi:hypothetical protein XarbCFBP8150_02670 [Xanthomonas arboricola]|nr:hypothetical protein XarbCFBP8153_09755 [Xanthomonas arboricola]PPT72649.1 hypothetical protein XarbCFBP8150_02670 [Xanthomonas arboricola]
MRTLRVSGRCRPADTRHTAHGTRHTAHGHVAQILRDGSIATSDFAVGRLGNADSVTTALSTKAPVSQAPAPC